MVKIRLALLSLLMVMTVSISAKKYPVIKFEKTTMDMGTFSIDDPVQKVKFKFTNVGKAKLVINFVHTACGCTVADYPKDFISPGASGVITVTYNGTGKMPGKIKKHIQVFSNCKDDMTRLFIVGEMTDMPREFNRKK